MRDEQKQLNIFFNELKINQFVTLYTVENFIRIISLDIINAWHD